MYIDKCWRWISRSLLGNSNSIQKKTEFNSPYLGFFGYMLYVSTAGIPSELDLQLLKQFVKC
jgi:hypothetical protein